MSNSFQYRDQWPALAPEWLTTGNAERYMYTLEYCRDLLVEKMNQAIQIRLPGQGDASQLPYLANDRLLVQGPAEPDANFVIRLREAFVTWGLAGSARSVLLNLQAYMQGLQPGVAPTLPLLTIVGGSATVSRWNQLYQGDALGALPTLTTKSPANFDWDNIDQPWRSWLILPMALVATGTGSSASTSSATAGSFASPGQNVAGVWIPATSGTPVNAPFITITGLSGVVPENVGSWLTFMGSSNPGNNGTFPIVEFLSPTSVVIANPNGVANDTGPLTWSVGSYPFIGPGRPYGSPGVVYGQGELSTPPIDTGENFGGVWQPSSSSVEGLGALLAWGLDVGPDEIISIRDLVKTWKGGSTYYPNIIIAFEAGTGAAGSAYSPNSAEGAGNPDGSFGSVGENVNGVWVPTRLISSEFDAYCQGTGVYQACSVENIT